MSAYIVKCLEPGLLFVYTVSMNTSKKATATSSEIASRLSSLRQKMGLTQREFAKEFGVTAGAVAHWESGKRSIPGPVIKLIEIYENAFLAKKKLQQEK